MKDARGFERGGHGGANCESTSFIDRLITGDSHRPI